MKKLLTILLISVSCCGHGQGKEDTLFANGIYRLIGDTANERFGLFSYTTLRVSDTVPVLMMGSDTGFKQASALKDFTNLPDYMIISSPQTFVVYGYQVTKEVPITFNSWHRFYPGIPTTEYKTIYLNHLKQPLPERLIVWMVVRRKEK